MKKFIYISLFCVCVSLFCYLALNVLLGKAFYIDGLNNYFRTTRTGFFDGFFEGVTILGDWKLLILFSFVFFMFTNDSKKSLYLIACVLIVMCLNLILKNIVKRIRPYGMLVFEDGFSFPSTHAMLSCLFWGFLVDIFTSNISKISIKFLAWIICLIIVITVALSRVYLNVHYCSDVLAGVIVGIALLLAVKYVYNIFNFKNKV